MTPPEGRGLVSLLGNSIFKSTSGHPQNYLHYVRRWIDELPFHSLE